MITIFGSLPKEELFLASADEIAKDIRTILIRYNTAEVFVSVRRDALGRGVSIMVVLPAAAFRGASGASSKLGWAVATRPRSSTTT